MRAARPSASVKAWMVTVAATIRVRICQAQIEAQAHRAARAGLVAARAQVARTAHMTDRVRADVLRDLDDEIAKIDGQGD